MSAFIGLILLGGILVLCLLGLLHPRYNDNIAHCVGMVVLALWVIAQVLRVLSIRHMGADDLWLCFGILCFGSGTAIRTWLYKRKQGN